MLSRLVRPSPSILGQLNALQQSQMVVRFAATSSPATTSASTPAKKRLTLVEVLELDPASKIPEGPERDLVNFPRPKRAIYPPKSTFGFIPESYFKLFYPRLGFTGGWTFGTGLVVYLLSKEIWVMEHEFWNGVSIFLILGYIIKKFGPQTSTMLENEMQKQCDELNAGKYAEIDAHNQGIADEKKAQWELEGCQQYLFEAKRQNVALQLEANYRERLMQVYGEIKKRLDYQAEKQNVERNVQQKHMVNWIVNKVQKSITPESEQENIRKCIADLKAMAGKASLA